MKEVHPKKLVLSDESEVPYGLLVWSTGVGPSEFVKSLNLPKSQGGRYTIKCNSHTARLCLDFRFVEGYRKGKEKLKIKSYICSLISPSFFLSLDKSLETHDPNTA